MIRLLAFAAVAAPAAAGAQTPTVQQQFDAATAAMQERDPRPALTLWETLERRVAGNKRTLALVHVRKGLTLLALGRYDEALASVRAGLADLPAADATLAADRFEARLAIAKILEAALDLSGAASAYAAALDLAKEPLDQLAALRGAVETGIFVDPAKASGYLNQARSLLTAANADKPTRATFLILQSRLLTNQGDFPGALAAANEAIALRGGLNERVSLFDIGARWDAAFAALKKGDADEARRLIAYTGAGRSDRFVFPRAVEMTPPECDGEDHLNPADVVIVQLAVGDDGRVIDSRPIYSAAGPAVAVAFARAARDWAWSPDAIAKVPLFWRAAIRLEMRCSTAFRRPGVDVLLDGALARWLGEHGVEGDVADTDTRSFAIAPQRQALAIAEQKHGPTALAVVPALHRLASNPIVPREERAAFAARELAILERADAPATARLAALRIDWIGSNADYWRPRTAYARIAPVLDQDPYKSDPAARAALALLAADEAKRFDPVRAKELLHRVADDPALPATDAFKVGALVRLASLEQQTGDAAAAAAAYQRSGVSAKQCALIDSQPRLKHASGDFPNAALRWGFEGWTSIQFDVQADGKVVNARAVVAYPPFIFSKAGEGTALGAAYERTYRPDGELGCGGETMNVKFQLPH